MDSNSNMCCKESCGKKLWFLPYTVFFLAFAFQTFHIIKEIVIPTETNIHVENQMLGELPILFKICVNPVFNNTMLKQEGYKKLGFNFFNGRMGMGTEKEYLGWGGLNGSNVRG